MSGRPESSAPYWGKYRGTVIDNVDPLVDHGAVGPRRGTQLGRSLRAVCIA
jgi:hypothetical protein